MKVDITETFRRDLSDIMRQESNPFRYLTVSLRTIKMKPRKIEKAVGFVCPPDLTKQIGDS